jgi:mannose-1-phosphate guanylyltransferase/mannose-6-phosphate isomerase
MLKPVFLSGGVGSRLWPVSREAYPKQFLPLAGDKPMLADTMARVAELAPAPPTVICNEAHRFIVAQLLHETGCHDGDIVLEPVGRNTAPAVAVAALRAMESDPDALLLVLPADHVILRPDAFREAVSKALPQAAAGRLVTFGVVPDRPETGYGYIRRADALDAATYAVAEFVEKPDADTAQRYVESGDYYWNSGMFLLGARTFLDELSRLAPEIVEACRQALANAATDLDFVRLEQQAFESCPSDSIDYAVMEKTDLGAVVPLDCGWSDVGAWSALWDVGQADSDGNVLHGDVLVDQSTNNYLRSESRLLAATGVHGLVVVETPDAVLVANRESVQDVKRLVTALKESGRDEARVHARVYRPWGSYESLINGDRFQVKRIVVNPGQKLSMQKHHHRAEHWIVVHGTAEVTCDSKTFMLGEDQSTYIPLGHKHRLMNPGRIPLELIEVQSGSYLGEDDIVRYDDIYGRGNAEEKAS